MRRLWAVSLEVPCLWAKEVRVAAEYEQDPELTQEQEVLIRKFSTEFVEEVDRALLAQAAPQWRKVARVVGAVMLEHKGRQPGVPDVWYAKRIAALVQAGRLEAQGNLKHMRFCEVRLSAQ
jgi:hypothetical protein